MRGTAWLRNGWISILCLELLFLGAVVAASIFHAHLGRTLLNKLSGPVEAVSVLPGLTVESAKSALSRLVVTSVRSDSEAALRGVTAGDQILAIDGKPRTLGETRRYMHNDRAANVRLRVAHKGGTHDILLRRSGDEHEPKIAGGR